MNSSITDDLKSFRRSWVHHTGMQLATLSVLAATFSVVVFATSMSLNLKHILHSWGDGVQITAYIREDVNQDRVNELRNEIRKLDEVTKVAYIAREAATQNFKTQMASYAPDLLTDADFSNPFPASFRVELKGGYSSQEDIISLEKTAGFISSLEGIEDVSYGQSWIHNYSSVVSTLYASSGVMAFILIAGSLFVIGNSIRSSISARREEIEILELVGATSSMIRRPFVMEGAAMGAMAVIVALGLNLGIYFWQKAAMSGSLVLARLVPLLSFLDITMIFSFVVFGTFIGAFGAWVTVRGINDGWSARSRGAEA